MPFTHVSHVLVKPSSSLSHTDNIAGLEPGEVSLVQASLDLLQTHADEREPGLGHSLAQMHNDKLRERKHRGRLWIPDVSHSDSCRCITDIYNLLRTVSQERTGLSWFSDVSGNGSQAFANAIFHRRHIVWRLNMLNTWGEALHSHFLGGKLKHEMYVCQN